MKPFNLEKALKGAKVVTRDGRKIVKICLNSSPMFPVTAFFEDKNEICYAISGRYNHSDYLHELDLMMDNELPFDKNTNDLNIGDEIMFMQGEEVLEGTVRYVLQNKKIIAQANTDKHLYVILGIYDVCPINKKEDE